MKKLIHKLLIVFVSFSLVACGQRKVSTPPSMTKSASTESAKVVQGTSQTPAVVNDDRSESPSRRHEVVEHLPTGNVRSCSTKTNAGQIVNGTLAVGLAFASGLFGPLTFVPALVAAANSHSYGKTDQLFKAAMKIVAANSNDNQLKGYAQDFLFDAHAHHPEALTDSDQKVFENARRYLESELMKSLRKRTGAPRRATLSIPNVEFAERVFVYDLRGSICAGGIKDFSTTKKLIADLVSNNVATIKTMNNGGSCTTQGCP